jgi:hypothetical protein
MRAEVVRRQDASRLEGAVLVADVRDSLGRVVLGRGTLIGTNCMYVSSISCLYRCYCLFLMLHVNFYVMFTD